MDTVYNEFRHNYVAKTMYDSKSIAPREPPWSEGLSNNGTAYIRDMNVYRNDKSSKM